MFRKNDIQFKTKLKIFVTLYSCRVSSYTRLYSFLRIKTYSNIARLELRKKRKKSNAICTVCLKKNFVKLTNGGN